MLFCADFRDRTSIGAISPFFCSSFLSRVFFVFSGPHPDRRMVFLHVSSYFYRPQGGFFVLFCVGSCLPVLHFVPPCGKFSFSSSGKFCPASSGRFSSPSSSGLFCPSSSGKFCPSSCGKFCSASVICSGFPFLRRFFSFEIFSFVPLVGFSFFCPLFFCKMIFFGRDVLTCVKK